MGVRGSCIFYYTLFMGVRGLYIIFSNPIKIKYNIMAKTNLINTILNIYKETGKYAKDVSTLTFADGEVSEVVIEYNTQEELEKLSLKDLNSIYSQLSKQN